MTVLLYQINSERHYERQRDCCERARAPQRVKPPDEVEDVGVEAHDAAAYSEAAADGYSGYHE